MQRYASLRRGLVGAWCPSVSGPFGYRLPDLSGYGNHGTLTNMDPGSDWVISGGKGALDFDGSNDFCDVLNSSALNPTVQISVCCWYYSRALPLSPFFNYCLLGKSSSVNAQPYPAFDIRGSSASTIEMAIAIGALSRQVSLGTISQNTWTHVVGTYNGSNLSGYRNGVVVQSSAQTGSIGTTTNPLRFGDNPGFTGRYFNGQFDDIRIYNRALSEQEIRLLASERGIGLKPERQRNRYSLPVTTSSRNRSSRFLGFPS